MLKQILLASVVGASLYVILLPVPENVEIPWRLKLFSMTLMAGFRLAPYTPASIKSFLDNQSRENMRANAPNVSYADTVFGGVPVRVFDDGETGESPAPRPAIVFYHGGGWTLGHVDLSHSLTAEMARKLRAVVVSVEYRLAPEHVFPASVDDCTAATVWFLTHAADFNVDPARVALVGESAGGNLAAAVAQRLTFDPEHRDLPRARLQVLIYPPLQAFDFQTPSYQQNGDYKSIIPNREWMVEFWTLYYGSPSPRPLMPSNQHTSAAAKTSPLVKKCLSHDLIPAEFKGRGYEAPSADAGDPAVYEEVRGVLLNPDFAPLMREELSGLPEAYILTAEYDVLRDDGLLYAKRLEAAAVPVTLKHYPTGYHAMFSPKDGPFISPSADRCVADFFDFASNNL